MRPALGLAIVGVVLGVIALFGLLSGPDDGGDVEAVETSLQPPTNVTTSAPDGAEPTLEPNVAARWSSNEISLLSELTAPARPTPARLNIEKIGIDAPVGAYGVDDEGRMDVPDNITEVGWYKFGPSPGEDGSAVLAAHVDVAGPGKGLFYDLDELEPGDPITVIYDDGSSEDFEVYARSIYLKAELPVEVIFSRSGKPVLTLVTCGGGFSRSTNSYDSNVVVYAVPVAGANDQEKIAD